MFSSQQNQPLEPHEQFRHIVENSTNLFYVHTPDHVLTYLSPQVKPLLGYEVEEALVRWTELATDNPINAAAVTLTQKAIDTGEAQPPYDLELRHKDGRTVRVEVRERPVVLDGQTAYMVGALTDITSQHEVKCALERQLQIEQNVARASAALLRPGTIDDNIPSALSALLEAADVARVYIFINFHDPVDGLCMRQDYEVCAAGVEPEIDNPVLQHVPYAGGFSRWKAELEEGRRVFGPVERFPEAEKDILLPQGILSILVLPIYTAGRWHGFIGFDETRFVREWQEEEVNLLQTAAEFIGGYMARLRAEEDLKESRENLAFALEGGQLGTWDWHMSKGVVHYSERWAAMLGYALSEVEETVDFFESHLHPDDKARALGRLSEHLQGQSALYESEHRLRRKGGGYVWVLDRGRVLQRDSEGAPLRVTGVIADISERKERDQEATRHQLRLRNLYQASQAILRCSDFVEAARQIFNACCTVTGAISGYVALLDETGQENEVLFLEDGGLPCTVDPTLPMPIRGLRAVAYHEKRVVYENDFMQSEWVRYMPEGHVEMHNVLFAPMILADKVEGVIGLANKPEPFTEEDGEYALAFADLAAIALRRFRRDSLLQGREEQLNRAQAVAHVGDWAFHLNTGNVTASLEARRIYGLPEEAPLRIQDVQKVPLEAYRPLLDQAQKDLVEKGASYDLEFCISRVNDGAIRRIHSLAEYDAENNRLFGIIQDVTERKRAEEEAAARAHAMDIARDGMAILDAEGRFVYVNQAQAAMCGYDAPGELLGKSWRMLYTEEQLARCEAEIVPVFESEGEWRGEMQCKRKDGSTLFQDVSVSALDDGGLISVTRDVSRRKQLQLYREMASEILAILNAPGSFDVAARQVLALLKQRTGTDAVGLRLQEGEAFPFFAQIGFPDGTPGQEDALAAPGLSNGICRNPDGGIDTRCICGLLLCGETDLPDLQMTADGSAWTNHFSPDPEMQGKASSDSGCLHETYTSIALVPVCAGGQIVGLLQLSAKRANLFNAEAIQALEHIASHLGGALLRKQGEEALRKNEELLNETGDMAKVGGWEIDRARQTLSWTRTTKRIHGVPDDYTPDYGEGVTYFSGDARDQIESALSRAILKGARYDLELPMITAEGQSLQVRVIGRPEMRDGVCVRVHGAIQDITEQKQGEEEREKLRDQLTQVQKMESIGRLAGGIAHDFNNMLSVILGHVDMALMDVAPTDILHENLEEIKKSANRSADLTRQLLAFARQQSCSPRALKVNATIEGMLKMLRRLIGEDIMLEWKPGPDTLMIEMDPTQLNQILANLVVNSRDAMHGGGRLTIETSFQTVDAEYASSIGDVKPGKYVVLVVRDNGCGMDAETRERVFEPFYTTKEVGEGTGLGLSTVYGIVTQHHGFLHLSSEVGLGATFRIYLPAIAGAREDAIEAEELEVPPGGNETLMLVEDEDAILALGKRMLQRLGYQVLAASKPSDALAIAQSHTEPIHLLITDVVMPEMNGRELAETLSRSRPDMEVLYMSGYSTDVIAHQGVLEDGVAFVQKPFSMPDMSRKIREILDR